MTCATGSQKPSITRIRAWSAILVRQTNRPHGSVVPHPLQNAHDGCRRHLKTDPVSERQNWISFRMPLTRSQTWLVNPGCRSRRTAIASRHSCSMEGADGPVLSTGNKLPISADGSRRRSWFIRHADRPDLLGHNCRPLSVVKEVGPCLPTGNIRVYCGTRAQLGLGGSLPMTRLVPSSTPAMI